MRGREAGPWAGECSEWRVAGALTWPGGPRPPGGRGRPRPLRWLSVPLAPFCRRSDLGRRVALAGHGGVEPGHGSAFAPPDPRGEHAPGRGLRRARGAGAAGSSPFCHSFVSWFVHSVVPGNWIRRSVGPWCSRGPPELGGGRPRETDTETAVIQPARAGSIDLSSRRHRNPSHPRVTAWVPGNVMGSGL